MRWPTPVPGAAGATAALFPSGMSQAAQLSEVSTAANDRVCTVGQSEIGGGAFEIAAAAIQAAVAGENRMLQIELKGLSLCLSAISIVIAIAAIAR